MKNIPAVPLLLKLGNAHALCPLFTRNTLSDKKQRARTANTFLIAN